jgi:hypothetical protein
MRQKDHRAHLAARSYSGEELMSSQGDREPTDEAWCRGLAPPDVPTLVIADDSILLKTACAARAD